MGFFEFCFVFKYMGYNSDKDLSEGSSQRVLGLLSFWITTLSFPNKDDFLNPILKLSFSLSKLGSSL